VIVEPLLKHVDKLSLFFEDIVRCWDERGGGPGLREVLEQKQQEIQTQKISGIMAFKNTAPIGFSWVDLVSENYGNIVLHTFQDEECEALAESAIKEGLLKGRLLELIQFRPNDLYWKTFTRYGYRDNFRQRMGMELTEETVPSPSIPPDIGFEPMSSDHIPETCVISYEAHQISKDQEGYPDIQSVEKRIGLEKRVFSGLFGKVITPASVVMRFKGHIIGFIVNVEIQCWGYEKVPWIFDISIKPEYHGLGYGRLLLLHSLAILQEMGYPVVGLAVTLSNTHALSLYEKMGFQLVEQFYEFVER